MRARPQLKRIALAGAAALCIAWAAAGTVGGDADGLPDVRLVTQDGLPLRLADDFAGNRVAVINFIFAGCSTASDRATARLREVQQRLGERMGREVVFYSITVAPQSDTPAALKRYADKFGAGPGWRFLTGSSEDIARLRQQLEQRVAVPQAVGEAGAALIIVDRRAGRWLSASPAADPAVLAALLDGAPQPAGSTLLARR